MPDSSRLYLDVLYIRPIGPIGVVSVLAVRLQGTQTARDRGMSSGDRMSVHHDQGSRND
jgi:hypothetical protein